MDKIAFALGYLFMAVVISFLFSWPAMWLWNNALVGAIDGVHEVTWLQAWGISILCNFLFKVKLSNKKD